MLHSCSRPLRNDAHAQVTAEAAGKLDKTAGLLSVSERLGRRCSLPVRKRQLSSWVIAVGAYMLG